MQSIKVTIMGKQYPLKVAANEVENMQQIARFVDEKFRLYRRELTQQPETTIMVLAALSIAEEMMELRKKLEAQPADETRVLRQVNERLEDLLKEIP